MYDLITENMMILPLTIESNLFVRFHVIKIITLYVNNQYNLCARFQIFNWINERMSDIDFCQLALDKLSRFNYSEFQGNPPQNHNFSINSAPYPHIWVAVIIELLWKLDISLVNPATFCTCVVWPLCWIGEIVSEGRRESVNHSLILIRPFYSPINRLTVHFN